MNRTLCKKWIHPHRANRHLTEKNISFSSIKRCAHFIMWHFLKSFFSVSCSHFLVECAWLGKPREHMQNKEKFETGESASFLSLSLFLYFFLSLSLFHWESVEVEIVVSGVHQGLQVDRGVGAIWIFTCSLPPSVCLSVCPSVCLSLASFSISALTKWEVLFVG